MKTKSVKFKHIFEGTWGCMLSIPKAWLEELGWDKNTKLALEYHPYKEEIIIMKDFRKLAPVRVPKIQENSTEPEVEVDDEETDND